MMMLSNVYAGRAMMDENCMRLMIEDSDKNVSEIWVYKDCNPVCKFSLEDNDRVIKEGAIDWDRARSLISANRRFDIEYEYYALCDRLIATAIRFRDEKEAEENMARYAYRTFSMWDNANKKRILNSMYGVSALGWSDILPTTMIAIPPRSNGKTARLKEFVKKCNLTVPEYLYCMNDITATKKIHDSEKEKEEMKFLVPKIKKVLYNEPAVIVFWEDDTKTVVRAQDGEPYDKEKGLAMAISKKALGNDRDYYGTFIRYKAVPKPKKDKKKDKKE